MPTANEANTMDKVNNSSENSEDAALKLVEVSKIYTQGEVQVRALDRVNLEIASGSFLSISGPSGSGKTTLLNMIGGLDTPTEGSIYVGGQRIGLLSAAERAEFRLRHVGFIFQSYNLVPVLSALENVSFVMQLQGVALKQRRERARSILAEVGLEGMEHRRPAELSGGQQQRVAVARAIVSEPDFVLADEPTANLDSATAGALLELMRKMNQQRGVTFIFSTHDRLVMEFAQRQIRLRDGAILSDELRIAAEETPNGEMGGKTDKETIKE